MALCLLLKEDGFPWAHLMWSLSFWIYLVEGGTVIDLWVSLRMTSIGSWGCLLYIRKYGLKPRVEIWVQLQVWTSAPIQPFQSDLHSGGSVPNILMRVELNLSHWPFVLGWYGLVLSFFSPLIYRGQL